MILQKLPEVFNDQLGGTCFPVFLEALVDPDDVHELVGQVVFTALPGFQGNGRPHRYRGDRQDGEDHPFGPCVIGVHPNDPDVLIRNVFEAVPDLCGGKFLPVFKVLGGLFELDIKLLLITVGANLDFACFLVDLIDKVIRPVPDFFNSRQLVHEMLFLCGVQQDPAAFPAGCPEQLSNDLVKPYVYNRSHKFDVPEVSRAFSSSPGTGLTAKPRVDNPEFRVHESHVNGEPVIIIGICRDDRGCTHLPDFFRGH